MHQESATTSSEQSLESSRYLEESNQFYQDLLGYAPEQTSLQQVPKK